MKVWQGYGSEHSANLVMIGRFEQVSDAVKAKEVIEWLVDQVKADVDAGLLQSGEPADRYSDGMLAVLQNANVHSIGPAELQQFEYDVMVRLEGNQLVLTTDEIDISAFLKVLLDKGARVEVFSAHKYPEQKPDSRQ